MTLVKYYLIAITRKCPFPSSRHLCTEFNKNQLSDPGVRAYNFVSKLVVSTDPTFSTYYILNLIVFNLKLEFCACK